MQAFERLDLFGKPVLLNFGGSEKSKSRVGALFTLGLVGFVIWIVYYFGKEIVEKKTPSVTDSQSFQENPGEMQINAETFVVNFGVQDKDTWELFMNESIYTFEAYLYQVTRIPQADGSSQVVSQNIPLELEPCTKAHFGTLEKSFSYVGFSSMYCLSKNQPNLKKGLSVLGKFESPVYQSIQVIGSLCNSNTSSVPCASVQEMEDKLGYFQLQFSNTAVNPVDFEKPVTRFRDSFFTPIGGVLGKEVDFWVSPLEITTDDGWLTESLKTESFIQESKISELISSRKEGDPFVVLYLQADGITRHFSRSYIKVQDVAARVNGIISFALIMLIIVATPYVRLKFYEALIHDLFDVKISKKNAVLSKPEEPEIASMNSKSEILTQGFSPRNQEINEFKAIDILEKKEEECTTQKKTEDFESMSPKVQDAERSLMVEEVRKESCSHQEEEEETEEITAQNLPSSRGSRGSRKKKTVLNKKETYQAPRLLKAKPDLAKPNFKAIMDENNEAFEDVLKEVVEENNNMQEINSTERGDWLKQEEDRIQREGREEVQIRKSPTLYLRNSDQINLTFWEYLKSFVCQTEAVKEKMYILNEGIRRINERLDIFNLLKKLREVDKLKILMLEDDQYILFEGLPKPEIVREAGGSPTLMKHNLKNAKFIQEKVKNDLIFSSYQNLKAKQEETLIDKKLLGIFDDIFIEK